MRLVAGRCGGSCPTAWRRKQTISNACAVKESYKRALNAKGFQTKCQTKNLNAGRTRFSASGSANRKEHLVTIPEKQSPRWGRVPHCGAYAYPHSQARQRQNREQVERTRTPYPPTRPVHTRTPYLVQPLATRTLGYWTPTWLCGPGSLALSNLGSCSSAPPSAPVSLLALHISLLAAAA
jgi:hypothetical protein